MSEPKMYGPCVRIRTEPKEGNGDDLVVEVLVTPEKRDGVDWPFPSREWQERWRTNDMSNDMAHTEADRKARHLRQQIVEGEA